MSKARADEEDGTLVRAGRLRLASARIRRSHDGAESREGRAMLALAALLDTEAGIRETQPRGFYEVADADTFADIYLED